MTSHSQSDTGRDRNRFMRDLATLAERGRGSLARFAGAARKLARNRAETRRLLADEVYRVPDEWLDDVVRISTRSATTDPRRGP